MLIKHLFIQLQLQSIVAKIFADEPYVFARQSIVRWQSTLLRQSAIFTYESKLFTDLTCLLAHIAFDKHTWIGQYGFQSVVAVTDHAVVFTDESINLHSKQIFTGELIIHSEFTKVFTNEYNIFAPRTNLQSDESYVQPKQSRVNEPHGINYIVYV